MFFSELPTHYKLPVSPPLSLPPPLFSLALSLCCSLPLLPTYCLSNFQFQNLLYILLFFKNFLQIFFRMINLEQNFLSTNFLESPAQIFMPQQLGWMTVDSALSTASKKPLEEQNVRLLL